MIDYKSFSSDDKMIDLIKDNYRLIQVLTRFGIPMGFGDKSVKKVCDENGVDCPTFLALVNFLIGDGEEKEHYRELHLLSLVQFLSNSHVYFLQYCLPAIRNKLLDAISLNDTDVSFLIIKLFDEYVAEVKAHMEEEEKTLFPYANAMSEGNPYNLKNPLRYSDHHEHVGQKLKELKNIIIKYCPPQQKVNVLNAALYDIYRCEEELNWHCLVEDNLLQPVLKNLENSKSRI